MILPPRTVLDSHGSSLVPIVLASKPCMRGWFSGGGGDVHSLDRPVITSKRAERNAGKYAARAPTTINVDETATNVAGPLHQQKKLGTLADGIGQFPVEVRDYTRGTRNGCSSAPGVKTEPRSASKLRTSDKSNCLREPVCRLCADTGRGVLMPRKVGQIVRRGTRIWLVRVHDGRDPESAKRKYLNQTIHGGLHDAQAHLNEMLSERDRGRSLDSSK